MTAAPIPASLRPPRNPVLQAPCPYCRAPAGQPCTAARGRRLATPHPSRTEALAKETP